MYKGGRKIVLPPLGRAGIQYNSQLLVVAGQSNALVSGISGATGLPSGWADTSRVQMWNGSAFVTYAPSAATNWGPEVAYAKAWLAANATGTLYMVKSAVANTQLGAIGTYGAANGATQDWAPADTLYTNLKAAVLAAKAGLTAPVNVTVLWMQGETDAMASNLATAYQSNLTALFAQMRADFGANVIVAGAVNDSRAWLRKDQIITAQIAVESSKNRFVTADDLAIQADGFHYTTTSTNALGTSLYNSVAGGSTATLANTLSAISQNCDPLITLSNSDLTATVASWFVRKRHSGYRQARRHVRQEIPRRDHRGGRARNWNWHRPCDQHVCGRDNLSRLQHFIRMRVRKRHRCAEWRSARNYLHHGVW
ncbi:hypothetical protein ACVWXO_008105 [Bradyrhizobium sp. LM2.7]